MTRPGPFAAILLILLASCGGGEARGARREIVFYCGAGLREPAERLIALFEKRFPVHVLTDYAGSEVLLSRLRLHNKGDLFMPGDARYVDQAAAAGLVLERKSLHRWKPVIFTPRGNPAGVKSLADLARGKVRLGLGDPKACAIGGLTRKLFEKQGIPWSEVEKRVTFFSLTVNELALQVQADSLDAVIVWDATARQFARYGEAIPIPDTENIASTIDLAILAFAEDKDLAGRLLRAAASPEGRAAFEGF